MTKQLFENGKSQSGTYTETAYTYGDEHLGV
jgi:hypothetical protein